MENPGILSMQIRRSEAYQVYLRLHTLSGNYYVLAKNYEVLTSLLAKAEDPEMFLQIWTQDTQNEMELVTNELMRRFHNFLASAKMLVDHTRTVIREHYSNTPFMNEYNKEVESRFIGNPLTGFIEDLRNYALHYQLPFTAGRYRPADGDAALRFILHSEQLQEWSNWSPKGSPFLDLYPKEIVVRNLAADYFKEIEAFQHWLFSRRERRV